jgi:hypothetical protein
MHAPPVDLELGGLGRVDGLTVDLQDQGVEAAHAGDGLLGVVVGIRRPQLVGPQHQPGAAQGLRPAQAEADPHQPDRGDQYL